MRSRAVAITVFLLIYLWAAINHVPHGTWDAWAIWNGTARLLAYNDVVKVWREAALPHADYPPLLPLVVAGGYRLMGGYTVAVPIVLHGAVYGGILWLLREKLWVLVLIGAVCLPYALIQFADLPLALCFLGAVVAYRTRHTASVGIALGVGLLVKNEGLLLALAFMGVWSVHEKRVLWRELAVVLPFFAVLLLFRSIVNVPSDVVGTTGSFQRLIDETRWIVLLPLLLQVVVGFGTGALWVLLGGMWLTRSRVFVTLPLVVVGVVLVGYVLIYAMTPHDIVWHVTSSWDRLLMQVFPVVVYEVAVTQKVKG